MWCGNPKTRRQATASTIGQVRFPGLGSLQVGAPSIKVGDTDGTKEFIEDQYLIDGEPCKTDDYGDPANAADFTVLRAYSPYHNIRSGQRYPAILVTTADTDDRVVPGHSFKYTAALQASDIGPMPHLIRIDTRAGHGAGKPTGKRIAETADQWAFIARHTGLRLPQGY
jgi:hypothetical protein